MNDVELQKKFDRKELELNALLEITQAINSNVPEESLYKIFRIKELPKLLDASDALAVAVCHHYQNGTEKAKKSSWESFVKENPKRVK